MERSDGRREIELRGASPADAGVAIVRISLLAPFRNPLAFAEDEIELRWMARGETQGGRRHPGAEIIPAQRLADWRPGSTVGVPGGIRTDRTHLIDVTGPPYNADDTGATDTQPTIMKAIADARVTRMWSICRPGGISKRLRPTTSQPSWNP